MTDLVNHPAHYTHGKVECIEIIRLLPFPLGSAIKYLYRLGHKDNEAQERAKAAWYIKDFLANHRPLQDTVSEAELLSMYLEDQDNPPLQSIGNFLFTHDYEYLHIALEQLAE